MSHSREINLPKFQQWYYEIRNALSQHVFDLGDCFGIAHASGRAILQDDLARFDKRLRLMHAIGKDDIKSTIAAVYSKIKNKQSLNEDEQIIAEIPAFIDLVNFYQNLRYFADWFPVGSKPVAQNATLSTRYLRSQKLAAQNTDVMEIDGFRGSYSNMELTSYLISLYSAAKNKNNPITVPFYLTLGNGMHAITLSFYQDQYIIIDANQLPSKVYPVASPTTEDFKMLAAKLEFALQTNLRFTSKAVSTKLYGLEKDKEQLQQLMTNWKNSERWKFIHDHAMCRFDPDLLYVAAANNDLPLVKVLAETTQLTDINSYQLSALEIAVANGHEEIVRFLLDKNDCPDKILMGHDSLSLYLAAKINRLDIATLLLAHGANPDMVYGKENKSLLFLAVSKGNLELVKLLVGYNNEHLDPISKIKKPGVTRKRADVELGNCQDPPLHAAIKCGHIDIAKFLLENYADVNKHNAECKTPLMLAIENKNGELVNLLTCHGAIVDVTTQFEIDQIHRNVCMQNNVSHFKKYLEQVLGDLKAILIENPSNQEMLSLKNELQAMQNTLQQPTSLDQQFQKYEEFFEKIKQAIIANRSSLSHSIINSCFKSVFNLHLMFELLLQLDNQINNLQQDMAKINSKTTKQEELQNLTLAKRKIRVLRDLKGVIIQSPDHDLADTIQTFLAKKSDYLLYSTNSDLLNARRKTDLLEIYTFFSNQPVKTATMVLLEKYIKKSLDYLPQCPYEILHTNTTHPPANKL